MARGAANARSVARSRRGAETMNQTTQARKSASNLRPRLLIVLSPMRSETGHQRGEDVGRIEDRIVWNGRAPPAEEMRQRIAAHPRQRPADLRLKEDDHRERQVEKDLARDRLERRKVESAGDEERRAEEHQADRH